jgi:hypothetical protein
MTTRLAANNLTAVPGRRTPDQADIVVTDDMRREACTRSRVGPVNGATLVANPELGELRLPEDYPEDYGEWWERPDPERPTEWADPAPYEYRNGGWYDMKGKRVHTMNERGQALTMYYRGDPVTDIAEKFKCAPSTVRNWAYRDRQQVAKVDRMPRFMAA